MPLRKKKDLVGGGWLWNCNEWSKGKQRHRAETGLEKVQQVKGEKQDDNCMWHEPCSACCDLTQTLKWGSRRQSWGLQVLEGQEGCVNINKVWERVKSKETPNPWISLHVQPCKWIELTILGLWQLKRVWWLFNQTNKLMLLMLI